MLTLTEADIQHAWRRKRETLTWFGPGEQPCRYEGELFDLGFGIPRRVPAFGFRSAVWHFCFGYMSGFPVSHILYFVATRCFVPALTRRIVSGNSRRIHAHTQQPVKHYGASA